VSSRRRRSQSAQGGRRPDRGTVWCYVIELSLELEADYEYLVFGPRVRQLLELASDGRPKPPDFGVLVNGCQEAPVQRNLLPFAWVVRLSAERASEGSGAGGQSLAVEARLRCEGISGRRFSEVFAQLCSELDRALWVDRGAPPPITAAPLDPFRLFGGESR
jgi:hypothetical protein